MGAAGKGGQLIKAALASHHQNLPPQATQSPHPQRDGAGVITP